MTQITRNQEEMAEEILKFAEEYLQPYKTHHRPNGTSEIVPVLCPLCKGGDNRDENTFALSIDKGLYVCKRGSCGKRGRFEDLAEFFGSKSSFQRPVTAVGGAKVSDYILPATELFPPTEEVYEFFRKRKLFCGNFAFLFSKRLAFFFELLSLLVNFFFKFLEIVLLNAQRRALRGE